MRKIGKIGRKISSALALVLASALVLTGCTSKGGDSGKASSGKKESSELRIAATFNPTDSLDPNTASSPGSMVLSFYLYDSLALLTPEGEKMMLAESVTPNATADEWTVKIRDNAKYSDGKDVTGEDVIASLKHISESPNFQSMYSKVDFANSTADGKTAVLKLTAPSSTFLISSIAMFSPVTAGGEFNGVGAGPFTYEKGDPATGYQLKANETYYGGKPAIPSVMLKNVPDSDSQVKALQAGEVDYVWGLDSSAVKILEKTPGIKFPSDSMDSAIIKELVLNTRVAPFNDPDVRRAAKLAVDREKMVNTLMGQNGVVGNDFPGMGFPNYPEDIEQTKANKDEARKIFADKGVTSFTITTADIMPGMVASTELLAQEFKEVGVEVTVKTLDPQSFYSQMPQLYAGEAFTFYWMNRMPLTNLENQIDKNSPYNVSGYTSDKLQANLDKALATVEPNEQKKLIKDICAEIHELGGDLMWGYQKQISAHREGLEGFSSTQTIPWIADATFTPAK